MAEVGEAAIAFAQDGLVVEGFGVASGLPGLEELVGLLCFWGLLVMPTRGVASGRALMGVVRVGVLVGVVRRSASICSSSWLGSFLMPGARWVLISWVGSRRWLRSAVRGVL